MDTKKNLIVIKCPKCGTRLSFKPIPNYREKKVTCPKCKHSAQAGNYILEYDPEQVVQEENEDTRITSGQVYIRCVETGEQHTLKNGSNTIGRKVASPKAEITFVDPEKYMSKLHASISVVNTGGRTRLHLRDENSTNGTSIKGKQVPKGSIVLLSPGVEFKMGNLNFVCTIPSEGNQSVSSNNEDTRMG